MLFKKPKVSVLMSVYNAEPYLRKSLDSLVNQTLKEIEIICVEDGSTDNSEEILKEYSKKYRNVKYYRQDRDNLGQYQALNGALLKARGKYVAECDADDWVELDMYEKLYKASEGKADVVSCGIYEEWGDTTTECKIVDNDSGLFRPDYFYNIRKIIGNKPCLPAGIYKRTFVIGNHLLYRIYAKYDDTSLLFRIRTNAKLYAIVSECLYHYRKNNPNSGSLTDLNTDGLREQYRYMREYDCIKGLRLECEITAIQFYGYLWHLSRFEDAKDREKFLKIMSKDLAAVPYRRDMFNSEEDYELFEKIREGRAKLKTE